MTQEEYTPTDFQGRSYEQYQNTMKMTTFGFGGLLILFILGLIAMSLA